MCGWKLHRKIAGILALSGWLLVVGVVEAARVGDVAPEFSARDLSNSPVQLSELRSRGYVLLVFWSTRCGYCHAMIPELKELHHDYGGKGLVVAAVNVGYEDRPEVVQYAQRHQLDYLVLNEDDRKADLAEAYQVMATPTVVLVAPGGQVLYRGFALPDPAQLFHAG